MTASHITELCAQARERLANHTTAAPTVVAYAPGRVEVLGNHTDYNEGFVLSAAIDCGHAFVLAPRDDGRSSITAGDIDETLEFDTTGALPDDYPGWAAYVLGVWAQVREEVETAPGFDALFFGDVPLGAGLSSSAALEISSGLALARHLGVDIEPLRLARIGQRAEHEYAGVKCGLMDQITSINGVPNGLVLSDFRSLDVRPVSLGADACFLMCNTKAKHALVDGEYNERRESCVAAAAYFAERLDHPVTALRDVSWVEWEAARADMPETPAKRAAHVIGENERVRQGQALLNTGDLKAFGKLMFDSHQSSIDQFENSCPELDRLVACARALPQVLGARLSGGGFGGSVVMLLHPTDAEAVMAAVNADYEQAFGHPCDCRVMVPSAGAALVD